MIIVTHLFCTPHYICFVKDKSTIVELVPTVLLMIDFSESSEEALRWAEHLANSHNANLKILYPYRLNQLKGKNDLGQLRKDIEMEAQYDFTKMVKKIFTNRIHYDFEAEVGFINDRIYSFTCKNNVLVVVISKNMVNTNKETLNDLFNNLGTPLLIVPTTEESNRTGRFRIQ